MEKGKFIVMEGAGDGIGKSTQHALLRDRLIADGENVITHHYPSYDTYHGRGVESFLRGDFGDLTDVSPYVANMLYAYDRLIKWYSEHKSLYESGATILLDRYTTSSIIYQSSVIDDLQKKKDFIDYVIDFEYGKLGLKVPDKTIFLYAPYDVVSNMLINRKGNAGIENDVFERDLEHMKRIYEHSLFVANYLGWDFVQCSQGDEMLDINTIHEKVYSLVRGVQ